MTGSLGMTAIVPQACKQKVEAWLQRKHAYVIPISSSTERGVLSLFTGLLLAAWLLSPVPALKPACSPSFQGPFCPIMRKQYLLLAVLGVLYSAYRQGLYLASFIPGDESNIQSNRITSHLSIYKPQLTSTFPIYHRISGGFPIFRSD